MEKRKAYEVALTTFGDGRVYNGRRYGRIVSVIVVADTLDRALELARAHYTTDEGEPNIWTVTDRGGREVIIDSPEVEEGE